MHLKGGLHVHTTCSDGRMTIEEAIRIYEGLGFDFIALTDHDFLMRPDCYARVDEIQTSMIIFKGIEKTVFEKGYVHVNQIRGERQTLHIFNHPSELSLPLEKALDRIMGVGKTLPIDALEVTSKGFYCKEFDTDAFPFQKVATDDAHTRAGCGRAWIEMDCPRNRDGIIKAVKAGDFWNCFVRNTPSWEQTH